MKKTWIIAFVFATGMIFSCENSVAETDANEEAAIEQIEKEADSIEAVNAEMEQKKKDIEESAKEVDDLLKDL